MFRAMDLDGNGSLDSAEFAGHLSDMGLGSGEIDALFQHLDTDSDGLVSLEEFVEGWPKYKKAGRNQTSLAAAPALPGAGDNAARYYEMQYASDVPLEEELEAIMAAGEIHAEQDEKIKAAFASAAADSSGTIDVKEFGKVLRGLGLRMSEDEVAAVAGSHLDKLDKDCNNSLDFDEFRRFYKRCMATSELKSKYAKKARKEGQKLLKEQHAPHAKRVFKEFDTDSSGSIDGAELVKVRCHNIAARLGCILLKMAYCRWCASCCRTSS